VQSHVARPAAPRNTAQQLLRHALPFECLFTSVANPPFLLSCREAEDQYSPTQQARKSLNPGTSFVL